MAKKDIRLTKPQIVELYTYVQGHPDLLKLTHDEATAVASRDLGFAVSPFTLRQAQLHYFPESKRAGKPKPEHALADLTARVFSLETRLNSLIKHSQEHAGFALQ